MLTWFKRRVLPWIILIGACTGMIALICLLYYLDHLRFCA